MVYIGKYYSDIMFSAEVFDTAILLYKPQYTCTDINIIAFSSNHVVNSNLLNMKFAQFVASILEKRNDGAESCVFYDYRTAINILKFNPSLEYKFVGSNFKYINWLNNKTATRLWMSNNLNTPSICVLPSNECVLNKLKDLFPGQDEFVIQADVSSGGKGTYMFTNETENAVRNRLAKSEFYLVSPYIKNSQTYNAHICVSKEWYWVSPISKQISKTVDSSPIYMGSTFDIDSNKIDATPLEEIARSLKNAGFCGICGIDFMLVNGTFTYIECNNRLQGSSALLDYILKLNSLPSLYQLMIDTYKETSYVNYSKLEITSTYKYITSQSDILCSSNFIRRSEIPMYRYWNL